VLLSFLVVAFVFWLSSFAERVGPASVVAVAFVFAFACLSERSEEPPQLQLHLQLHLPLPLQVPAVILNAVKDPEQSPPRNNPSDLSTHAFPPGKPGSSRAQ